MRKISAIIVFVVTALACSSSNKHLGSNTKVKDSNMSGIKRDPSKVTPLPFGPQVSDMKQFYKLQFDAGIFYEKIIGSDIDDNPKYTASYKLPEIRTYEMFSIEEDDNFVCGQGVKLDSVFELNYYKIRLPDLQNNEVYYYSDDKHALTDFAPSFTSKCGNLLPQRYGYLLIYNRDSKYCRIIQIYKENYIDSYKFRDFYIDRSYVMHVRQRTFTDGDQVEGELDWIYKISVQNDNLKKDKVK